MQNKVVKNAIWIIVCRIVQAVLSLVVTMLTARYLSPSGYGIISYAASLVLFVAPIMKLGLDSIIVQAVVNTPEDEGKIMGTVFTLSILSGVACIIGVFAFVLVANAGDWTTIWVCVLYSISLLFQGLELIQYYFQAKLKSKYTSVVGLIAYFVVSVYKILLLIMQSNIYYFAISQALDYLIISVLLIVIYHKLGGKKMEFSRATARRLISTSKYYIVSSLMVVIFSTTDKIMINIMLGDVQTGLYSAAVTCALITSFVFGAIIDSARPSIFACKKNNSPDFEKNVSRLYSIIIYLSLIQSLVIMIFAPLIINIIYGQEYLGAVDALRIVVWYTMFSYFGYVRNIWILAENKQKYLWIVNLTGALANVALNFVFIPLCGIEGAAIASLITQFFANVIMSLIIRPLRKNNLIMLKGFNPKLIVDMIKSRR